MNTQRVLVCGATGFIGRNVIERLATRKDLRVSGTYYETAPTAALCNASHITMIQVDLTQQEQVNRVMHGQHIVIQAAAVTTGSKDTVARPYLHVTDNAVMNSLLLRACFEQHVRHLIFLSSATLYPYNQPRPVREDECNYHLLDSYFGIGWTKLYTEKMCEFYSRISPTKYAAIRPSNIYGPYDKYDLEHSHVLGATVTKVMSSTDGVITVWGDGSEARDLLYVSDLVDAVEAIMERQRDPFELINVGSGSSIPVKELVEKIIELSGKELTIEFDQGKPTIPFSVALNVEKACAKYSWRPKVSLEEGIRKTLAWYQEHLMSSRSQVPGDTSAQPPCLPHA